jgi:uncharacterized phiE125 gp8 family phage protein
MLVSLSSLKLHCAIDADETYYDDMLTEMHDAAVEWLESKTRLVFRESTVVIYYGEFGETLVLPVWPVNSLTSISYEDKNGDTQSLTNYQAELLSPPATIYPAPNETFPETEVERKKAVTVTVNAGYETIAEIPKMVNHAIKMLVAHWFRNRETVLVGSSSKELEYAVNALMVQSRVNYFTSFGVYQ